MNDFEKKALSIDELNYDAQGLIPAIVQDERDGAVLMMAYMNKQSLQLTLDEGRAWFFSRSRQSLWLKGETSGNILKVSQISYDCDGDTLLIRVAVQGDEVACHTGARSCFYRFLKKENNQ